MEQIHNFDLGKPITLKEIEDIVTKMYEEHKRNKSKRIVYQVVAHDYPMFSDEEFKVFVTDPGFKFIGGYKDCEKMLARCKKLNIPIN